jgi:hypothetical protein
LAARLVYDVLAGDHTDDAVAPAAQSAAPPSAKTPRLARAEVPRAGTPVDDRKVAQPHALKEVQHAD